MTSQMVYDPREQWLRSQKESSGILLPNGEFENARKVKIRDVSHEGEFLNVTFEAEGDTVVKRVIEIQDLERKEIAGLLVMFPELFPRTILPLGTNANDPEDSGHFVIESAYAQQSRKLGELWIASGRFNKLGAASLQESMTEAALLERTGDQSELVMRTVRMFTEDLSWVVGQVRDNSLHPIDCTEGKLHPAPIVAIVREMHREATLRLIPGAVSANERYPGAGWLRNLLGMLDKLSPGEADGQEQKAVIILPERPDHRPLPTQAKSRYQRIIETGEGANDMIQRMEGQDPHSN